MALKEYQQTLTLGRLYEVKLAPIRDSREQIAPSIWVNSGSIDIYASQSGTQPSALADMTLNDNDTAIEGVASFDLQGNTIPRYIAVTQNAGTSTEIVITGVSINDLGAIS